MEDAETDVADRRDEIPDDFFRTTKSSTTTVIELCLAHSHRGERSSSTATPMLILRLAPIR